MELAKKATKYILENKKNVIDIYRSTFHMEPSIGWMNDPNGLIYVDGEFHLFYQANPYEAKKRFPKLKNFDSVAAGIMIEDYFNSLF